MIKFSLAGYYSKYTLNSMILALYKTNREVFYDNVEIESVYGSLPGMVWTGCRFIPQIPEVNPYSSAIYDLRDMYNDFGIQMRHTFTNSELTEDMLLDFRCNEWLRACEQEHNGVIVTTELLANYVREKYPKYDIIWSTSCGLTDIEKINKLSETDLVVLDYSFNTDKNALKNFKNPHNLEILCAEYCIDNCPMRQAHYKVHSQMILNEEKNRYMETTCPYSSPYHSSFYEILEARDHVLTHEQVEELYNEYGICHFKLNGRVLTTIDYIEIMMYYLIKPEYRDRVRMNMLLGFYEE